MRAWWGAYWTRRWRRVGSIRLRRGRRRPLRQFLAKDNFRFHHRLARYLMGTREDWTMAFISRASTGSRYSGGKFSPARRAVCS